MRSAATERSPGRVGNAWWLCVMLVAVGWLATSCSEPTAEAEVDMSEFANLMELDPADFDESSINIDNEWWPLPPGKQMVYEGNTVEDGESIPHRIVFTVTDLVKEINGVRTVVIFDRDYTDGRLLESELAFFAQDKQGNVWHLGQYSEIYDETELVGGRIWHVGNPKEAKAGIMMPANPRLGDPSYSQGWAPQPFNWTDRARVYQVDQEVTVPYTSYTGVLVTEEYTEDAPDGFQLKYYARGVGNIKVGWRGNDQQQEDLQLVDVLQLEGDELVAIREEALQLETRGYMYSMTPPAVPRDVAGTR